MISKALTPLAGCIVLDLFSFCQPVKLAEIFMPAANNRFSLSGANSINDFDCYQFSHYEIKHHRVFKTPAYVLGALAYVNCWIKIMIRIS